jgi:hypothetical protein
VRITSRGGPSATRVLQQQNEYAVIDRHHTTAATGMSAMRLRHDLP